MFNAIKEFLFGKKPTTETKAEEREVKPAVKPAAPKKPRAKKPAEKKATAAKKPVAKKSATKKTKSKPVL